MVRPVLYYIELCGRFGFDSSLEISCERDYGPLLEQSADSEP